MVSVKDVSGYFFESISEMISSIDGKFIFFILMILPSIVLLVLFHLI